MTGYGKDIQIRVGVCGNPKFPNYVLEQLFFDNDEPEHPGCPVTMAIYNGRTQKEFDYNQLGEYSESWSSAAMTFVEVQALIGELRAPRIAVKPRAPTA
ncbi:hypothetical protein RQ479_21280 [Mesorhizobium sp. ISC25]|uniref:hypothetical protein n=1 Tax=Mesorhizobium sp. ISC25 TaxID=3077335 RepID=UPI0035E096BF